MAQEVLQLVLVQEKHIDSMIQDFKAESIANTLWAYATAMRHPGERILDVLRQSEKIVGSFDVRDVADALWALAVFSINCPNSFKPGHWLGVEQIGRRAEDLAGRLDSTALMETLWALAMLRFDPKSGVVVAMERQIEVLATELHAPLGPDPESVGVTAPPILSEGVLALITKQAVHDIEAFGPRPQQTWTPMQLRCPYA